MRTARQGGQGVMDVAGTLDHVGGAAGTCDFFCGGCGWDCMWSSAGAGRGGFDDWSLPGPAGTVQRGKKNAAGNQKTGKPKKEPKDLAEAAKKIPKPKLEDLQDAARTLWPAEKGSAPHPAGIRVDLLRLSATLGGAEDPAAAAELYGGLHALVWTGMPALEKLVVIRDPGIHLGIDFDAQETRAEGELGISIRLGTLIAVGTQLAVPAIGWLRRFMKRRRMPPASKAADNKAAEHPPRDEKGWHPWTRQWTRRDPSAT